MQSATGAPMSRRVLFDHLYVDCSLCVRGDSAVLSDARWLMALSAPFFIPGQSGAEATRFGPILCQLFSVPDFTTCERDAVLSLDVGNNKG
jgi:hypothetical protein